MITSGLDTREFSFYGFLPINKKLRKDKLEEIKKENKTIILYEAPHKLNNTLVDLEKIIEDRQVVIARELTKIHEEFIRGTVKEIMEKYPEPRGEHIILIQGSSIKAKDEESEMLNNMTIKEHYNYYEKQGLTKNEIIKKIAKDRKVNKNEIYKMFI